MVVEITQEKVYIFIIIVLCAIQIIQWSWIRKCNNVVSEILDHVKVVTTMYGAKILELEKKIENERSKNK
jgi:hypothetical protein